MLVAVTSIEPDRASEVDTDFGRTHYVLFLDLDSGDLEVFDNLENMEVEQDAGVRVAREVLERNPEWVLTGSIGQKSFEVLTEAGIKIGIGASGTVRDAVKRFNFGEFEEREKPLPCKDQYKPEAGTDSETKLEKLDDSKDTEKESRVYQTGDTSFIAYRPQVSSKRAPRQE